MQRIGSAGDCTEASGRFIISSGTARLWWRCLFYLRGLLAPPNGGIEARPLPN